MTFELIDLGASRSVPEGDGLREHSRTGADTLLVIGGDAVARARSFLTMDLSTRRAVVIELGTECLGFHVGEGTEVPGNVIGFARFQLGALSPSPLVELVGLPGTLSQALTAAREIFETAGLDVALCADVPGRIVDGLLRPYLNAALRGIDEGLAPAADLDKALRLGLGFPKGPIELLEASGVEAHFQVSSELYGALGAAAFLPARRARVQASRRKAGLGKGTDDEIRNHSH